MGLPIYRNSPCAEPQYKSPPPAAKHDAPAQARSTIRRGIARHRSHSTRGGRNTDAMIEAIANAAGAEYLDNNNSEAPGREVPSEITAIIDTLNSRTQQTDGVNDNDFLWHGETYGFEANPSISYTVLPEPRPRFRSTEGIRSADDAASSSVYIASSRRPNADHEPSSARYRPRRQATIVPDPAVNGLGDRERSWTPESERDQWDTLLTTITPDPSLPSASSSFASAQPTQSNEVTGSQPQPQGRRQDNLQPHRSLGSGIARFRSPLSMATPASESADNNTRQTELRSPSPISHLLSYPEPILSLVSPSNTSDSEEAASLSGRRVRVSRQPRDGTRDYNPRRPTRPFWSSDAPIYNTGNTSLGSNSPSEQLRANHTEQLRSFNETYTRYMNWNRHNDRYGLEISPEVDLGITARSLSNFRNLLRRNLMRQEQYLRNTGAGATATAAVFDEGPALDNDELIGPPPPANLPSPSQYSNDSDDGPRAGLFNPHYRGG